MDKFEIKNGALYKNGNKTICPISPTTILPNPINQGQFDLIEMPCNVNCPMFAHSIIKNNTTGEEKKAVKFRCVTSLPYVALEPEKEIKKY